MGAAPSTLDQRLKACFAQSIARQLREPSLRLKDEASLRAHLHDYLRESCVKPLGIDVTQDKMAAFLLKHTSCVMAKAIKRNCVSQECVRGLATECLDQYRLGASTVAARHSPGGKVTPGKATPPSAKPHGSPASKKPKKSSKSRAASKKKPTASKKKSTASKKKPTASKKKSTASKKVKKTSSKK